MNRPPSLCLPGCRSLLLLGVSCLLTSVSASGQAAPWFEFDNAVPDQYISLNAERISDIDGDGIADILLGDPLWLGDPIAVIGPGHIQVRSGADGTLIYEVFGPTIGDQFGYSTADIGDVNGDGVADIAVGAPGGFGPTGRVHVLSGVDGTSLFTVDGAPVGCLGWAISSLGDVNGDSIPDFVAAQPSGGSGGTCSIFSGADGERLAGVTGVSTVADNFVTDVTNLGDVDGDGIPDLALGMPNETAKTGKVQVHSGATSNLIYRLDGLAFGERFGHPVVAIGDVDGDGVSDFAASATRFEVGGLTTGQVRVYSGVDGDLLYEVTGTSDAQSMGAALAPIPDVNADGIPDFLVSDYQGRVTGRGTVHVISGLDGASLQVIPNRDGGYFLGLSMCAIDDINGDGSTEFAVVSQGDFYVGTPARVTVFATGCATESTPVCTSLPNSTGMVGTLTVSGCGNSTIGGTFELAAADLPVNQFGIMVQSQVANNAPLGSGILCIGLPFVRLLEPGGVILNSGPTGTIVSHYDLGTLPQMTQVLAGATWRFQLYHRDTDPTGSNLTNSVNLMF